jgi:hypothetical protein
MAFTIEAPGVKNAYIKALLANTRGEVAAPSQGMAQMANALLGGWMVGSGEAEEREKEAKTAALLQGLPGLLGGISAPMGMSVPEATPAPMPARPTPAPAPAPVPIAPGSPNARVAQGFADVQSAIDSGVIDPRGANNLPPAPSRIPPAAATAQAQAPVDVPRPTPVPSASAGIDPQSAQYIRALVANPGTRKEGMQLYNTLLSKSAIDKPTFGKVGTDPTTGADIMGFIDARRGTVKPYQMPGGSAAESTIPPAPPGVDPKVWRTEMTKRAMGEAIPAEAAGRLAMMDTAQKGMSTTRKVLEGDWDASKIAQYYAAKGGVGAAAGDIGTARRDVRLAIEAALRAMTGAAAPESEVSRYEDLFMPTPWDNAKSRQQKLDNLDDFMNGARKMIQQGRTLPGTAPPAPPPTAAPSAPTPAITSPREGATATNPQTGEKRIFKSGRWVPMQ